MRLSDETHQRVERFFREHRGDPALVLPPVFIHRGPLARLVMKLVGKGAITFGRHVLVTPSLIREGPGGRAEIPGWLLVHEAAHVLQYEERGFLRFLRDYLKGYWRALRAGGSWDAGGRMAAYLAIEEEFEARSAERAFLAAGEAFEGGARGQGPRPGSPIRSA